MRVVSTHFILYVSDQGAATRFYTYVLGQEPSLHVPGMTEFSLGAGGVLGLMPESGARRLLGAGIVAAGGSGTARVEVYLRVDEPDVCHARAVERGARELSPLGPRDWGDVAAYSLDADGHVLAFARRAS